MLGPAFYIVGALAFLLIEPSTSLTLKQANSVCALVPEGERLANPLQCTQYYECKKGKAVLNSCLGNNLFSKDAQSCVPANQSPCGQSTDEPCLNMPDGYFVPVYNSCKDFYYCSNGVGSKSSCPNGLNFDQVDQSCKYQEDYPCSESNPEDGSVPLCDVVQSGVYFGSSSSCYAWQKCSSSGPPETKNCDAPYIFNVDTRACDFAENYVCRQTQGDSTGSSLEGTPCEEKGEVRAGETCSGYYVCMGGKWMSGRCINTQYYDTESKKCAPRLEAINDCDRCEGTKLQFVNLYQDDCRGYGYCQNGKMQSKGECKEGYFDEVSGSCVVDGSNPNYPVCREPTDPTESVPSSTSSSSSSSTSSSTEAAATSSTTDATPKKTTVTPTDGGDKGDGDKTETGKEDSDKGDGDKTETGKEDSDKGDGDKTGTEKEDTEKGDGDKAETEKEDSDKGDGDKTETEKEDSDKGDADKTATEKRGGNSGTMTGTEKRGGNSGIVYGDKKPTNEN